MKHPTFVSQLVSGLLLPALAFGSIPVAPSLARAEEPGKPLASPSPPAPTVNRTLPKVRPPVLTPKFGAQPTDEEIFAARVFAEPLTPIGGASSAADNAALARVIEAYLQTGNSENLSPFERFLDTHPDSAWKASMLTNMGIVWRRTGYFTKALAAWEEAWTLGRSATEPKAHAIADRALGELLELNARLGRHERLEELLNEIQDRDVRGSVTEKISGSKQALWLMRNRPEMSFRCGPLALAKIHAVLTGAAHPKLVEAESTAQGTSLFQMLTLAQGVGMKMQAAHRSPEGSFILPAMVHWKAGHFAALVERQGERYRVQDPTFGEEMWVSATALRGETSGYFLVPAGPLPSGWRAVASDEASTIWGKGAPNGQNTQAQTSATPQVGGPQGCPPMAVYSFHTMLANLHITDRPVGYTPPVGPAIEFQVTYNHRDAFQPQIFTYSNLGAKWTFDWMSYVTDDPGLVGQSPTVYLRGGGQETYSGFNSATNSYAPHYMSHAVLVRVSGSPIHYERLLPDGSKEVFAQPDGAQTAPRNVFLTEWQDPQGNAIQLTYDFINSGSNPRLVAIRDAVGSGQVTTLAYDLPGDPLKITKVTDPFGRFATLEYDSGRLVRITDVIGIVSEFTYGSGDFITSLTTPYGTTSFEMGESGRQRWVQATDPLGGKELLYYQNDSATNLPASADPAVVPSAPGFSPENVLHSGASFFWDKRQMALGAGDFNKATVTYWMWSPASQADAVKRIEKAPLENPVWYTHSGDIGRQLWGDSLPSHVGRVLDDGTTQLYRYEYNSKGKMTKATDPVGRETVYVYGTNNVPDPDPATGTGIDLLQVKQKNGANWDVVQTFTYNAQHQPLTITDAAGQTTTNTYLSDNTGRLQTVVTPPRNGHDGNPLSVAERTTTYEYYPDNDPLASSRLKKVTAPSVSGGSGPTTTLTYDAPGRVKTTTDSEGYELIMDYDDLDRLTKTTYPDGSYEETKYNRLDVEARRDRLGRWTHTFHDALRRVQAARDPLGRTVTYNWCNCGSLDSIVDGAGNKTTWDRDLQGRVKKEIRADGKFWEYTYETTTSRLKSVKDPKQQLKTYTHDLDDKLTGIAYTSEVIATPDVTFKYRDGQNQPEPYGRLLSMTDATGTTAYDYHPVGTLGATLIRSVDGPMSDLLEYGYDELGRIRNRKLNGTANEVMYGFDSLGRLRTETTPLGDFTYSYDGVTERVLALVYPNAQRVDYGHYGNTGDHRLQQIHNKLPGAATLSKFDYTYDKVGNIETWAQQRGASSAETYTLGYDRADQLRKATLTSTAGAILKTYGYGYDNAGNRTVEAVDTAGASTVATTTGHNNRNWITSQAGGGLLPVAGLLNEAATVTISGVPASVGADNRFSGQAQLATGLQQTFTVVATDASGNARTNTYQVDVSGAAGGPFTYDDNGNLTSDGVKTYDWDAENRLVAVKQGGNTIASFVYDGNGRRYQKTASGVTHTYLYDGAQLIEERLSSGATQKYFDGPGIDQHLASQDQAGVASYYAADHLGNVTEVTTSAGGVSLTRGYDPWGNLLSGGSTGGYAYTGREWDAEISLYYYRARYHDPKIGRFLSEDPIPTADRLVRELNGYVYVANNPPNRVDPFGLESGDIWRDWMDPSDIRRLRGQDYNLTCIEKCEIGCFLTWMTAVRGACTLVCVPILSGPSGGIGAPVACFISCTGHMIVPYLVCKQGCPTKCQKCQ